VKSNRKPDIMVLAKGKWPSILRGTGIDERALSQKHGPCPMCGGKDRFRTIQLDGDLRWICNQCGGGDGMDLYMGITSQDFKQAADDLRPTVGGYQCLPPDVIQKKDRRRIMKNNVELWGDGVSQHPMLEEYLKSRGLAPAEYAGADLRLAEKVPYFDEDGKRKGTLPAMLARVSTRDGKLALVHRTYLHKRADNFEFATKKKMTSSARDWKGGGIRLFGTKQAHQKMTSSAMIVAEGIETALSMRARVYRKSGLLVPCWAAVSANAMENIAIPDHITHVLIGADNDASFTGQKAAYTLANRLTLHKQWKKKVTVEVPDEIDTDWNDEIRRAA